jgi:hypothetical protein
MSEQDKGLEASRSQPCADASALARGADEYWSVSIAFNGVNILTIGQSKYSGDLSGVPNIEDYADIVRLAAEHLASFIGPDEPQSCFVCGGDCGSANPPVVECPMRPAASDGGEAVQLGNSGMNQND